MVVRVLVLRPKDGTGVVRVMLVMLVQRLVHHHDVYAWDAAEREKDESVFGLKLIQIKKKTLTVAHRPFHPRTMRVSFGRSSMEVRLLLL